MQRDDPSLEARARRRASRKLGFWIHAAVYATVNLGLYALPLVSGDPRGPHGPLMGWAVGLAIHGAVTLLSLSTEGLRRRVHDHEMRALLRSEGR